MNGVPLSGEEFTARLTDITENRLADHHFGVSALAREMKMSRYSLHRKMKVAYQCSASRFICRKRLEKAHQLMQNKEFTVTETASRCGFNSVTYFDKCFRNQFGYPPGKVKRQNQKIAFQEKSNILSNTVYRMLKLFMGKPDAGENKYKNTNDTNC
ncbi:MAG: helix-turn-helix domain-containing protein [Bacteroidota bacterium]